MNRHIWLPEVVEWLHIATYERDIRITKEITMKQKANSVYMVTKQSASTICRLVIKQKIGLSVS